MAPTRSTRRTPSDRTPDRTSARSTPSRAAVLGGNRIPFARANGAYAKASNQDMLTTALEGLVARFGLAGERLGEVAAGAVLKHSRDFNLTREAVLGSSLAATTPAYDVQQACGTGLEATILVANKIALGQIDSGRRRWHRHHLGRTDWPSARDLRRALLRANAAQLRQDATSQRVSALASRSVPGTARDRSSRSNGEPRTGLSMGDHMAITAKEWGITREAQDELTVAQPPRTSPRRTSPGLLR